jgi:hypothetical protein
MLFQGGFTFTNFIADVFAVFVFVVWFSLVFTVLADLLRRSDISGWGKAIWVILLVLLPYIGVFVYLVSQGRGMAERNEQRAGARNDLRQYLGLSAADEIEKLDRLKSSGRISSEEYGPLRAKVVQ